MKQSSCLGTAYQSCQKVPLSLSMYQSRVLPQDLINTLPEGCIAEIFKHLEDPEDRQSCASVCWKWAEILVSQRPDFWGPFSVHQAVHHCLHLSDVDDVKLVEAVVGMHTRDVVTDLDLWQGRTLDELTDSGIHFVTSACRNLKSICLVNCFSVTNEASWIIASNCPGLEDLVILETSISDDGLSQVAKQCRSLKSLRIEGSFDITEVSLRALVQDAKRLESLTLGRCPKIGGDAILSFLMNQPYLDKLELKGMVFGELHCSGARQSSGLHRHFCLFRQLSSLILVNCQGLQDLHLLQFGRIHFQMPQHLVIDDCRGVTDRGLTWLVGNAMKPIKLKTIKLARFNFLTSTAVMEVMSLFYKTIESIILDSCDYGIMTPLLGEAELRKCPELKVIRMEHCRRILHPFLSWVKIVCCGLKEVRLIGGYAECYCITTRLCSVLHYNRITKIELRFCNVTDAHVWDIATSCREALQELILDACTEILGNFVPTLRERYPNLIRLCLNFAQIKDAHIRNLMLEGFEHLEELSLMGRPLITGIVLIIFATTPLPKLRKVNLSGCPNITEETIDEYVLLWEIEI